MKVIRTIWLVAIAIAFWQTILVLAGVWLIWCILCTKRTEATIVDGVKMWWEWIKAGIRMNIDFVKNGINGY